MPFKFTPAAADALTAVGDTGGFGVATVTSTANFYPDATVWLRNGSTTGEYIVTSILSATTMGLRAVRPPYGGQTYGNSTLASSRRLPRISASVCARQLACSLRWWSPSS